MVGGVNVGGMDYNDHGGCHVDCCGDEYHGDHSVGHSDGDADTGNREQWL